MTPNNHPEDRDLWVGNALNAGSSTMTAVPDPDYPTGTWGPEDTPKHLQVWDQPVDADPTIPGFSATNLDLPKVITIYDTNSESLPPYERPLEAGLDAWVVIPHPDHANWTLFRGRALLQ